MYEPEPESTGEGLAGLLNRASNEEANLNADLVITVNDVPHVAVGLQGAIVSIEMMVGIMTEREPAMAHIDDDYLAETLEDPAEATDRTDADTEPSNGSDEQEGQEEPVESRVADSRKRPYMDPVVRPDGLDCTYRTYVQQIRHEPSATVLSSVSGITSLSEGGRR